MSTIIYNSLDIQQGSEKRPFRLSSISRGENNTWYHMFKYLDNGEYFTLQINEFDKPIRKL